MLQNSFFRYRTSESSWETFSGILDRSHPFIMTTIITTIITVILLFTLLFISAVSSLGLLRVHHRHHLRKRR